MNTATHRQTNESARRLLSTGQMILGLVIVMALAADGILFGGTALLRHLMTATILFYLTFVTLKVTVWLAGTRFKPLDYELPDPESDDLPFYTVFVPMYDEVAVLPNLVKALARLRYRKDRLRVMLLLEQHDTKTIEAARLLKLPSFIEIVIVPPGGPKGKPNACNYGFWLAQQTSVDYKVVTNELKHMCTIFDAEDRPEEDHLLKAVGSMWVEKDRDAMVACVQSILVFWNSDSAATSKYYWAEYVTHFRWMLPGFAKLGLIPPLGGTSNHFDVAALLQVALRNEATTLQTNEGELTINGPWDAYNVTEDADLAARLRRLKYRVAMCFAVTFEEAPNHLTEGMFQRSRWLKGYLQTGLVYARQVLNNIRKMGLIPWACFELMMLGTPLSLLLNPVMWATTTLYVICRVENVTAVTTYIDQLFYTPVFYIGVLVMIGGNLTLFYQKLSTSIYQRNYAVTKWLLLTPMWWAFTSTSAYLATFELLVPSLRHHWRKTTHGHDQGREEQMLSQRVPTTQVLPITQSRELTED